MRNRKRIVGVLRRLHLLSFAESCRYRLEWLRTRAANRRFQRANPGFRAPPGPLLFDIANHTCWELYQSMAQQHARLFADVLLEHVAATPMAVLEWGCGPGRLIQFMGGLLAARAPQLTGTDANADSVAWCRANVPGPTFVVNGFEPPLPFADGAFDASYNYSVLTHLSEPVQQRWVAELARVLRPGGVLACTTHGDHFQDHLLPADLAAYRRGQLVVLDGVVEGKKHFLTYHPPSYVRNQLLRDFEIVAHLPCAPDREFYQDLWVARKPAR
jgi:SAM-dependent methyltransferase